MALYMGRVCLSVCVIVCTSGVNARQKVAFMTAVTHLQQQRHRGQRLGHEAIQHLANASGDVTRYVRNNTVTRNSTSLGVAASQVAGGVCLYPASLTPAYCH